MAATSRGAFASKLGIILATAGSAVGLGNIWRFPFMTGQNGGAAFIVLYMVFVLILGLPGVISEFIVGRHGATNAARAYRKFGGHSAWGLIGFMGVITSTIILGFYSIVAGWCLHYLYASIVGDIPGDKEGVARYFTDFSSSAIEPTVWGIAFIVITTLVVVRGIRNGIEKASKVMMPTLLILLFIIVVASLLLPNSMSGVKFLLHPDFSKLTGGVFLDALGQAFFSLSLGTACLCTYASYFSRTTNLGQSAVQIAVLDTGIAVLAGLMIFPAAFSVGISPDAGPSLIFITLPNVFSQAFASMPMVGYVISILFYALLALAALTSTISMHEIGTAFVTEEFHVSRKSAAISITAIASVIAILSSLGNGAIDVRIFDKSMMDFFDFLTGQILLPLGAFLTSILVGWCVRVDKVKEEFTNNNTVMKGLFGMYIFAVRIICPVGIAIIFLRQFGVI